MVGEWFRTGDDEGTALYRIEIEETKIISIPTGDIDIGIRIPYKLEFNTEWHEKEIHVEPVVFYAHLSQYSNDKWLKIADAHPAVGDKTRNFDFSLSLDKVEVIETLRDGKDAQFKLDITGTFSASERKTWSNRIPLTFNTNVFNRQVSLAPIVPKSIWEDKVYPGLGIDALQSITIRIPPGFSKGLAEPLSELNDAVKALARATSEPDFESVVGKSRISIESMLNQLPLKLPKRPDGNTDTSYKAKIKALSDQFLIPILGKSQAKHVAAVMNDLWAPFSAAAHPGPSKFDRSYARFSIQQAAAVLAIVAEVLLSIK